MTSTPGSCFNAFLGFDLLFEVPKLCSHLARAVCSFTDMVCEHLTLDVSDALGTKKMALSKTVKKVPLGHELEHAGAAMRDEKLPMPAYDEVGHPSSCPNHLRH